jgi:hypothetical protein
MMNSDLYFPSDNKVWASTARGLEKFDDWCRIPYVNFALLRGLKRSGTKELNGKNKGDKDGSHLDMDGFGTLGARCRVLVQGFDESSQESLVCRFIAYNRKALPKAIPWFLTEEVGGLGLPCCGDFEPTFLDKGLAGKIISGKMGAPPKYVNVDRQVGMSSTLFYDQCSRFVGDEVGWSSEDTNGERLIDFFFWSMLIRGCPFGMEPEMGKVNSLTRLETYWQDVSKDFLRPDLYDPLFRRVSDKFVRAYCVSH